jgi:hypothetical protein
MIRRHLLGIPLAFAIGLLEILAAAAPVAAAEPITCALIPDTALEFHLSASFALAEVELSRRPEIILLERAEIDKVIDEQSLQLSFSVDGGATRRRLGTLLKADLLIFLKARENEIEEDEKVRFVELIVADPSTGLRLFSATHPWDEKNPDALSKDVVSDTADARRKLTGGIKAIIAVPPFISDDLTHEYDTMQEAYAELLRRRLASMDGVFLVESAEARAFAEEQALSGVEFAGRPLLPLYVLGHYRNEGTGIDRQVRISVEIRRGGKPVVDATSETIPSAESAQYLNKLTDSIITDVLNQPQLP